MPVKNKKSPNKIPAMLIGPRLGTLDANKMNMGPPSSAALMGEKKVVNGLIASGNVPITIEISNKAEKIPVMIKSLTVSLFFIAREVTIFAYPLGCFQPSSGPIIVFWRGDVPPCLFAGT